VQAELTSTPAPDDTSDAVLLLRTREGSSDAYGALYLRHVGAARVLARQLARDPSEVDELVAESFARVLAVLQRGAGPEVAFRPYLLSTMRRLHVDRRVAERRTEPTDDLTAHDPGEAFVDAPADELERSLVSSAFISLPERWRLVLWHTEVEGLQPAQVAPLLGISANATAALAVRARAGLRDAYLSAHVADSTEPGCREVAASLGGYVRGTLSRRERAAVDDHLDGCARCKAAVLELSDTAATMRSVIGPLILGAAVLGYREGLLALGPHAIPTFAALQSGAAAGSAGSGGATGGTSGGSSAGTGGGSAGGVANAARPVWQLIGAAGVAGTVVIAVVVAIVFAGGSGRPAADRSTPTPTTDSPSATATSGSTATPSPSSGSSSSTSAPTAPTPPLPSVGGPAAVPPATAGPSSSPSSSSSTEPPTEPPVSAPVVADPVTAVGDLVAGRRGYLSLRVTNPGATAVSQTLNLDLPAGVAFDPTGQVGAPAFAKGARSATTSAFDLAALTTVPADTGETADTGPCGAQGATVVCHLGRVTAGASTQVVVPVAVDATATGGTWTGSLVAADGGSERSTPLDGSLAIAQGGGVNAVFAAEGRYEVSAAGNALMSCQDPAAKPNAACAAVESAREGTRLTNGEWPMYPRNDAGTGWKDSSSAHVAWPAGGTVVRAWLSWSATGVDPAGVQTARLRGPDSTDLGVDADEVVPVEVSGHRGYVAMADVTDAVSGSSPGTWTVGNVSVAAAGAKQQYAGWSLTVVTSEPTAPVGDVTVLSGPRVLANGPDWTGSALGLRGGPASLSLVAWEGDAGNSGDDLSVYGRALTPEDGNSDSADVVASYANGALGRDGKPERLSFGVDVRSFASPSGSTGNGSISLHGRGDSFILGLLAVTTGEDAAL
jgi:RNA polymerase sigma factor (sigma-70 family)